MENFDNAWNLLPEEEQTIQVEVGEDIYELHPSNTELYTHVGKLAMYNCIYHFNEEDETAMYIFSEQEGFIELATLMAQFSFPVFFHMREVEPYIKRAYENMIIKQMWEGIPDGLDGTEE